MVRCVCFFCGYRVFRCGRVFFSCYLCGLIWIVEIDLVCRGCEFVWVVSVGWVVLSVGVFVVLCWGLWCKDVIDVEEFV